MIFNSIPHTYGFISHKAEKLKNIGKYENTKVANHSLAPDLFPSGSRACFGADLVSIYCTVIAGLNHSSSEFCPK